MIDAHAGALGVLGGLPDDALASQAALVAGTSNCVMALSRWAIGAPGLWGPCRATVLPGLWVTEGGQSTAGALFDQVCRLSGQAPDTRLHARIAERIADLRVSEGWDLGGELHVLPDFRGNRSPHADPEALGAISGMALDGSLDGLARLYWRVAVALALGLREVIDALRAAGAGVERLHATGGHARAPLLMELYATATQATVETHDDADGVLLGAAMAAATAARLHPDVRTAALAMRASGREVLPDPRGARRLDHDFRILKAMRRHRAEIRAISETAGAA
jgi:ribulose kinase